MPILQRRAAQWYERNREPEEALEYWMKAGEVDSAARLVGALTFPAYQRGRVATVERWLGWLEDRAAMESYPAIAVLAAMFCALTGNRPTPNYGPTSPTGEPPSRACRTGARHSSRGWR